MWFHTLPPLISSLSRHSEWQTNLLKTVFRIRLFIKEKLNAVAIWRFPQFSGCVYAVLFCIVLLLSANLLRRTENEITNPPCGHHVFKLVSKNIPEARNYLGELN